MEKIGVSVFQKVAKTGNMEKKSPVAGDINYGFGLISVLQPFNTF